VVEMSGDLQEIVALLHATRLGIDEAKGSV
jgi:hypothetical protein